jgi:hypothetical protein
MMSFKRKYGNVGSKTVNMLTVSVNKNTNMVNVTLTLN